MISTMMRSPRVLLLALALLVVQQAHCFMPTGARRAFISQSSLGMTPTRPHDEWELPEEVPDRSHEKASTSSWSSSDEQLSETRRQRLSREASRKKKYVTGDDLYHLRQHAMSLREELQQARQLQATRRVQELEQAILKVQQVDAEFVYSVNLERMETAQLQGRMEDYERYHDDAMEARSALPQYNLDGLWVGKYVHTYIHTYIHDDMSIVSTTRMNLTPLLHSTLFRYGDNCYEMINVTYDGDTLMAHKVTGHSTVPSGEVSFQANLSPFASTQVLDPIELGEPAAQQWGTQYLPRFSGNGQVASKGFTNPQFVEGQLIMVNEYFSFAWIPLGHQVFFGRPSAELTLKMLKEQHVPRSEAEQSRAHLDRCMEETALLEEEMEEEHFYSTNQYDYYNQEGCFE